MADAETHRWRVLAVLAVAVSLALRLWFNGHIELLPEEAYYWNYARHPAPGYLDHPPMVAWLIAMGTALFGTSEWGVRIGAICASLVATFFIWALTRRLYGARSAWASVLFMQLLPFAFLGGALATPDAPLLAAWAAALYFLERALLASQPAAWLGAGVALGLGLLSKYTMGLIVPAALTFIALDNDARRWLRSPAPYLAAALAMLLFVPVLYWNATHDWASFAFQTSRRLAEAPRFSLHKLVGSIAVLISPLGLIGLWRLLAARDWGGHSASEARARRFLRIFLWVPLIVFIVFSLRHDVKLDWTSAVWLAAIPAFARDLAGEATANRAASTRRRLAWGAMMMVLLVMYGTGFYHLAYGLSWVPESRQTELVPVGWRALAKQIGVARQATRDLQGRPPLIVGMDRYETASELSFYLNALPADEVTGVHLLDGEALMYARWQPAAQARGRALLLVAWSRAALESQSIAAHAASLDPIGEIAIQRGGRPIRSAFVRVIRDYRP